MKVRAIVVLSLLISASLIGCKKEDPQLSTTPKEIRLPAQSVQMISYGNKFGLDLFSKVAMLDDKNLMLSPVSASIALTMLLNGCDASTLTQIKSMLGYNDLTLEQVNEVYKSLVSQLLSVDPSVRFAIANAVWVKKNFEVKIPFMESMRNTFDAHIQSLDFSLPSSLVTINKWASDNTFGKIPKVLDEISPPQMVMFLMNAIYFKGNWSYQFDESRTQNEAFHLADATQLDVPMMHLTFDASVYECENFKALELCYGRKNFSMIVILPNGNIGDFYNKFSLESWNDLSDYFSQSTPIKELKISLPKFKFSYEKRLNDELISMGMKDAFDPSLANLSGIANNNLYVDFVKQNTFVEVNESGTEAAAVTTVGVGETSVGGEDEFVVNKPFVFVIRERTTNTILFIGKVINPNL